jgi:hypothetical protein
MKYLYTQLPYTPDKEINREQRIIIDRKIVVKGVRKINKEKKIYSNNEEKK